MVQHTLAVAVGSGSGSLEVADTCTFVAVPSMTSQMEFDSPHRAFPYTVDSLPTWLPLLVPAIGAIHQLKSSLSPSMYLPWIGWLRWLLP